MNFKSKTSLFALCLLILPVGLAACRDEQEIMPTEVAALPEISVAPTETPTATASPSPTPSPTSTNTPLPPATNTPQPTATPLPSATPLILPTSTPQPTNPPLPTNTPTPTPTPLPTATPLPPPPTPIPPTPTPTEPPSTPVISDVNLLPNASFEEGYYHVGGIAELQVPNRWTLEWDEGPNYLDPDPWNAFVRPESRVLSGAFLPPAEHGLFIWNGDHTVKIFKQTGALSFRMVTYVDLQPGTYIFEIKVFPDMIDGYNPDGSKIWAPDPLSGEIQFIVNSPQGGWILPAFGQRNTLQHYFDLQDGGTIRLGVAFRGRWAIENNGWFMDDWSLRQVS